jgi:hypothetical protein
MWLKFRTIFFFKVTAVVIVIMIKLKCKWLLSAGVWQSGRYLYHHCQDFKFSWSVHKNTYVKIFLHHCSVPWQGLGEWGRIYLETELLLLTFLLISLLFKMLRWWPCFLLISCEFLFVYLADCGIYIIASQLSWQTDILLRTEPLPWQKIHFEYILV